MNDKSADSMLLETTQSIHNALRMLSKTYSQAFAELDNSLASTVSDYLQDVVAQTLASSAIQQAFDIWEQQRRDLLESSATPYIEPPVLGSSVLQNVVDSCARFTDIINKTWEPLQELFDQMDIDAQEMGRIFAQAGFWLTPSMPMSVWKEARALKEQGRLTPDTLKRLIFETLREGDGAILREMVDEWYKDERFARRRRIFDDALEAHLSVKYTLSIPALLPQIEGIMVEIAEEGRYGKLEPAAKAIVRKVMETKTGLAPVTSGPFVGEVKKFYASTAKHEFSPDRFPDKAKRDWKRDLPELLNRPAILHGVQIDYDSEENSLRGFLLLDELCLLAREQKRETRAK